MNILIKPRWNTFALVSVALGLAVVAVTGYLFMNREQPKQTPRESEFSDATGKISTTIDINGCLFNPAYTRINTNTRVTWNNYDPISHAIELSPADELNEPLAKSPVLNQNDSFSFTFDKPGRYEFRCLIYPKMSGSIIVEP